VISPATYRDTRSFRSAFNVRRSPEHGLPSGKIEISAFVAEGFVQAHVDAAYVALSDRAREVHESRPFDDGAVVLDFDSKGRIVGAELTTMLNGLADLKEFLRYAKDNPAARVMVITALNIGRRFEIALVDAAATARAITQQIAAQGVTFRINDVQIRESLVQLVQQEPASARWQQREAVPA
jgi:uncharacterized protein YuzE